MTEDFDNLDKLLKDMMNRVKEKGCSIEGCKEEATGIGDGKPYCSGHFWSELDKQYPEE